MSMIRVYVADLLHTPLPDLSPPAFDGGQLHGLQKLPRFCAHLKLIYGLKALEPLAERPESENLEAIVFAARTPPSISIDASRQAMTRDQVRDLLFAPLPELNPPGFRPDQLEGLRALPPFCRRLKPAFGLWALEPLADGPPSPIFDALTLSAELLAAIGGYLARRKPAGEVSLRSLRVAATLTLFHHRPPPDDPRLKESQMLLSTETLLLEAAELSPLRRARSDGTSEEVLSCAALMVVALWQLADRLRLLPGAEPGELNLVNRTPALVRILSTLAIECAADELVSEGQVPIVLPPAVRRSRRRGLRQSGRRGFPGGRAA